MLYKHTDKFRRMSAIIEDLGANLILTNGKVVTVDPQETISQAVAIRDGRFLKIGTNEEIKGLAKSDARVIDLKGRTVLPGFIDTHEHCIRRGLQSDYVSCRSPPMETIDDIVQALAAKAATKPEGEWVVGSWFDETKLRDHRWPNRYDLDRASDKHPVYLGRAGGHNSVANSMALAAAGITKDTPQPEGGRIEKDEQGEPTGRLDEIAAMNMVRGMIPTPSPEESTEIMVENWPTVEETLLSWGLTTIHEAHIKAPSALAYQELLKNGKLRMRVGLMLDGMAPYSGYATSDLARQGLRTSFGWGDKLYVVGVKLGVDGAMGSLTASLTEPYANDPENYGINRVTQEELTEETVRLHKAGNRVCIHAIGDWAIDIALNAIEAAVNSKPWPDHRHRIEHAGYVRPDQLKKMKDLGIAVSASIGFCHPIGDSHIDALGQERLVGYYPMRSFKEHGIVAAGNSDGFGANWALTGIYGCATRKSSSGRLLAHEQAIPIMDAIRAYTTNAAYLDGKEDKKGSIEPGKLADLIVLDRDILTLDPEEILETKVLMTIVGGEVVYKAPSAQ